MRLGDFLPNLREQEAPPAEAAAEVPSAPALAITSSDDIAPYPMPLFMRPVSRAGLSIAKPRRRKKRKRQLRESSFASFDDMFDDLIETVKAGINKRLARIGFICVDKPSSRDDGLTLTVSAPSKADYFFRAFHGWLIMTLGDEEVFMKPAIGPLCVDQLFLAWKLPSEQESLGMWTVEGIATKIIHETCTYLVKCEAMREVRPFVDLSISNPVTPEDLVKIREDFEIIKPSAYQGTFSNIGVYLQRHGGGTFANFSESQIMFYEPMNKWTRFWSDQDQALMIEMMKDVKYAGYECKIESWGISWGDVARLRMFPALPGLFEIKCPGPGGQYRWATFHTIPKIPHGMERVYYLEAREAIQAISSAPGIDKSSWDNPGLLREIWQSGIDDIGYTGGIAYHRDGQWGLDFYQTGLGGGALDPSMSHAQSFYWGIDDANFLHFIIDANTTSKFTSRGPSSAVLEAWFHPSISVEKIAIIIQHFTLSS